MDFDRKIEKLKEFLEECRRVWLVLKKPTKEEYINVAKITALGITVLGVIGYIIHVPAVYIKTTIFKK
ncbi:preprotein translocase subunit SecE [Methanocaldococcus villosus KIN24-T80]|uniref:Protein translocase subunit SecE n=1 Tax=Methanocaldococcus villosus KIN24-T80 TaxID=1069083 RepID=N6VR11_9EURY|nr:protein translocase SEC61 complex subunit gamma [Methanocaldococcus villosus]ENN96345.1 preprotein translocase subunit SecE [Methanocaldococcus villosus KIN24-T80]